jgi:integrase/recombinase XerC
MAVVWRNKEDFPMPKTDHARGIFISQAQDTYLLTWIEGFLIDRQARGLSSGTMMFYRQKLKLFVDYCESREIKRMEQATPTELRLFLISLEEGHNAGGIHAAYRAIRAFFHWFEDEAEPDGWRNPIDRVKAPKVPDEPLDPVEIETVKKMIAACQSGTFYGNRDKAILLSLLDTGARAKEFLSINLDDLQQATGEILIREGKGNKPRFVFLGRTARKAVRAYLKLRRDYPLLYG